MEDGLDRTHNETKLLCSRLNETQMNFENLEEDEDKLKFYTGLDPIAALKAEFELIAPCEEEHHLASLTKVQQFLIVLMRVSQSTISKNKKNGFI